MSQPWTPWNPWRRAVGWAAASHERALDNARAATTELSRRRVERDDVALFLAERLGRARPGAGGDQRPA